MSYAAVFDFRDEAAYKAFDTDDEHNRLRRDLFASTIARAERCQILV
jgi:hypothetical protein